ncbi:MAG: carboxylating nicotinate-nucleotide diphosphorylase [Candidatus Diapherotrites archaeon]|nr:carboxylating nicotinate-nucleotide diphosphorylase [Candidatus Diapherotrites archaeon]
MQHHQEKMLLEILASDLARGDVSTRLTPAAKCTATIMAGEKCVLSGVEEAVYLLRHAKARVTVHKKDAQTAKKGERIITASGQNREILECERTVLNVLGRMSGVATLCKKASRISGKKTKIFLTRKTMPGFNEFDKKACMHGGVFPHRKNLSEMILFKDNHLEFAGIRELLEKAGKAKKSTPAKKIEIEVEDTKQALKAAQNGADIIMLDNFSPNGAKKTIARIKKINPRALVELSGGITLKNLGQYVNLGADMVSMGQLTKEAKMVDFSMTIKKVKY